MSRIDERYTYNFGVNRHVKNAYTSPRTSDWLLSKMGILMRLW